MTEFFTVSASAPGYEVHTLTVAGAMSGYCSIGSDTNPMTPKMTIRMEITVESTGRFINAVNVIIV